MYVCACPVCDSATTEVVFERPRVPVAQNIVFSTREDAAATARRDLALAHCSACDFVFNAAFDEDAVAYDERYDNAQLSSSAYAAYIEDLVSYLTDERALNGSRIVEVGCGKGEFLRRLVSREGSRIRGLGFDPSYRGPRVDLDGRLMIEQAMFEPGIENLEADSVLCRHVIEHIATPRAFLQSIVKAAESDRPVTFFFETPSLEWILEQNAFWDIFYEHCNYWTDASIRALFREAGLAVDRVRRIWQDQFLWIEGRPGKIEPSTRASAPDDGLRERIRAFASRERDQRAALMAEIEPRAGRVALWGAAAKGVTLANLVDPDGTRIAALIDINPNKQGKFIAGSAHAIVAPQTIAASNVELIYVMNPNYFAECQAMLKELGCEAELRTI